MSDPALCAKSVSIRFGGLRALTEFKLELHPGDLKGLIGPNGAGKTTAFNVLTGVYRPTEGTVCVAGREVSGPSVQLGRTEALLTLVGMLAGLGLLVGGAVQEEASAVVPVVAGVLVAALSFGLRRLRLRALLKARGAKALSFRPHQINRAGVARTFQNIRLFKALTALDNVKVACLGTAAPLISAERVRRAPTWLAGFLDALNNYYDWWRALLLTPGFQREEEALTRRAEELLEVMGLAHRRDEEAKNLPYGEQRRLEIARALGTRPKVLLLDEPAAGMNTKEKAELMVLIRKLRDQFSLGILLIEHDMKLVMGICEQITVLDHGETIAVGTPEQVRANPKVIEAYLGDSYLESQGMAVPATGAAT